MTLLYESNAPGGPGTHVLAIGVGHYPHLINGGSKLAKKPLGLGQLESPPESARAFINWCLAPLLTPGVVGFTNSSAPLASVEALASIKVPVSIVTPSGSQQLDEPTRNNVRQAFEDWLERVASHQDNIGVFYFCGHGVMFENHYLLCSDFGKSNGMPWENGFDISNTLRAVEREVSGSIYFLIDACREMSRAIGMTPSGQSLPLLTPDLGKPVIRRSTTLIEATGEGERAFAPSGGQVARFTDALLTAMSGFCGVKSAGSQTWDVDGETLAGAVRKLLELSNTDVETTANQQVSQQSISGTSVPLLRQTVCPKVKVQLDLTPTQKRMLYELYLTSAQGTQYPQNCVDSTFHTEVPRGYYTVGARAHAGPLPSSEYRDEELIPPLYGLTFELPP